jgi:hypothetical protein
MHVRIKNKVLRHKAAGMTNREISRAFNVSVGSVSNICTNKVKPIYTADPSRALDIPSMVGKTYKVFGFPDPHIPDHDPVAMDIAIKAQRYFSPDVTIIGNDFVQCTPFQQHKVNSLKDSSIKGRDFSDYTIKPANKIIDRIQDNTSLTVFQQGNHDAWVERWAARSGQTGKSVHSLVSLKKNLADNRADFIWMPEYGVPVKLHEKWYSVHGWSFCKNAASKHRELSKTMNIVFHHTHRKQSDSGGNYWDESSTEAMSAGCLCMKKPMYKHDKAPTQWVHAFWIGFVGKHSSTRYAVPIENGRAIMPDGKEIK